jgi:hypothetical protein
MVIIIDTDIQADGNYRRQNMNGKWGLVDKTGAEVIPNIYDAFLYHSTDYYETVLNEKKGLLDKHRKELLPPTYDEIDFSNNVLMRVKRNGKYGFIDSIGKEIVWRWQTNTIGGKARNK